MFLHLSSVAGTPFCLDTSQQRSLDVSALHVLSCTIRSCEYVLSDHATPSRVPTVSYDPCMRQPPHHVPIVSSKPASRDFQLWELGIARFRQILKKIMQTKLSMGTNLRGASFAMTEAKYAAGDFRHTVFDNVEQVPSKSKGLSFPFLRVHHPHVSFLCAMTHVLFC